MIESLFSQLLDKVQATRDFEAVRFAHEQFLSSLLSQSFLHMKTVSLFSLRPPWRSSSLMFQVERAMPLPCLCPVFQCRVYFTEMFVFMPHGKTEWLYGVMLVALLSSSFSLASCLGHGHGNPPAPLHMWAPPTLQQVITCTRSSRALDPTLHRVGKFVVDLALLE